MVTEKIMVIAISIMALIVSPIAGGLLYTRLIGIKQVKTVDALLYGALWLLMMCAVVMFIYIIFEVFFPNDIWTMGRLTNPQQ